MVATSLLQHIAILVDDAKLGGAFHNSKREKSMSYIG